MVGEQEVSNTISFSIEQTLNTTNGIVGSNAYKEMPMSWVQDGSDLRIDITLPGETKFSLSLPQKVKNLFINGETIWKDFERISSNSSQFILEQNTSEFKFVSEIEGSLHILVQFGKRTN